MLPPVDPAQADGFFNTLCGLGEACDDEDVTLSAPPRLTLSAPPRLSAADAAANALAASKKAKRKGFRALLAKRWQPKKPQLTRPTRLTRNHHSTCWIF